MFGKSRPVVIDTYSSRRARPKLPAWLVTLLLGLGGGAAAVIYVQERHLPPRLSMDASAKLRESFETADRERQRLQAELAETSKMLDAALADKKTSDDQLAAARKSTESLREQLGMLVEALPPDPRGGAIEVRAARFSNERGALAYEVVLTRESTRGKPFTGVMQFSVSGTAAGGAETTVTLQPIAVSIGQFQSLSGSLPLPEGFDPRQSTIHVRDKVDGKVMGMRVMYVR